MKHCMLLWKKPSAKPLQTQIDCAFDVFSVIRDLREEYSPHFYKANKKKTSQPIAWSADAFMEALKKNPVNKGNQLLGELGYSISMYYRLLIKPCIVDAVYWKRGYFFAKGNRSVPLVDELDYGFWSFRRQSFQNLNGEPMESNPIVMGIYGVTTITGVASEMKRALIAKGIL